MFYIRDRGDVANLRRMQPRPTKITLYMVSSNTYSTLSAKEVFHRSVQCLVFASGNGIQKNGEAWICGLRHYSTSLKNLKSLTFRKMSLPCETCLIPFSSILGHNLTKLRFDFNCVFSWKVCVLLPRALSILRAVTDLCFSQCKFTGDVVDLIITSSTFQRSS